MERIKTDHRMELDHVSFRDTKKVSITWRNSSVFRSEKRRWCHHLAYPQKYWMNKKSISSFWTEKSWGEECDGSLLSFLAAPRQVYHLGVRVVGNNEQHYMWQKKTKRDTVGMSGARSHTTPKESIGGWWHHTGMGLSLCFDGARCIEKRWLVTKTKATNSLHHYYSIWGIMGVNHFSSKYVNGFSLQVKYSMITFDWLHYPEVIHESWNRDGTEREMAWNGFTSRDPISRDHVK